MSTNTTQWGQILKNEKMKKNRQPRSQVQRGTASFLEELCSKYREIQGHSNSQYSCLRLSQNFLLLYLSEDGLNFFIILFIYLVLAVLVLCSWTGFSLAVWCGLLMVVASLVADHGPQSMRASVVAHGLSSSSSWALEHGLSGCGAWA